MSSQLISYINVANVCLPQASSYYVTLALWRFVVDRGNIHQYQLCSRGKAGVFVDAMGTSALGVWIDGYGISN